MKTEILSTRRYKAGYIVHTEEIIMEGNPDTIIKSAYTSGGAYIGSSRWAFRLCKKRGIKPEVKPILSCDEHPEEANGGRGKTCSIGFSEKEQKWYGWSHRALFGFGIGDVVKEGDCTASSGWVDEYLEEHPEADRSLPVGFKATTLGDTKKMAIAFADSVN